MDTDTTLIEAEDQIDRRGFLKCMAWAGTGVLWTLQGGVLKGLSLGALARAGGEAPRGEFAFVQISDSHIGFNKPANADVTGTLTEAIGKIARLSAKPDFLIHTGDISHLSKPEEFDTADQVLKAGGIGHAFFVPGEHDVLDDGEKLYLDRYGKRTKGAGWYSFDHRGVHFIGLVNVVNLKAGGLGNLGQDQLGWLQQDVAGLSSSTPIVVFAHIPLWSVYPDWGWGTGDAEQALSYLKRFGSVTVLNGHIHQVLQKVEGNITFHTAASTAFPQPAPGQGKGPGPMTVDPGKLRDLLGIREVAYAPKNSILAVTDTPLSAELSAGREVAIDNFSFRPASLSVAAGTSVTWVNRDDIPHTVVSADGAFPKSPPLDTGDKYAYRFARPGRFRYFCSLHPRMEGTVLVS